MIFATDYTKKVHSVAIFFTYMVEIKIATLSDAALIADISRETFHATFAAHNSKADMDKFLSEQFCKEQLIAEVGAAGNIFLLAYTDGIPAGYVFLKDGTHLALQTTQAIEISRLYSRTSFIGKGIGKILMEASIALARKMAKDCIWLGVWEHNQRAINFYLKFGFEKFSEHDFTLGDDIQKDWLMKLMV